METFKKEDLLAGMLVTLSDKQSVKIGALGIGFKSKIDYILLDDYSDDLYYIAEDTEDDKESMVHIEHNLDIMRVCLPSGAVLWERPVIEARIFDTSLYKATRGAIAAASDDLSEQIIADYHFNTKPWFVELNGKLCTFKSNSAIGSYAGYFVAREWTRELTGDERKNWRKEHPRT